MTATSKNNDNSLDYSALVLGFSSAALSYMGFSAEESDSAIKKNQTLARQNIEIITLLKEKTKGNLTSDEEHLTDQVLTDLRMKFVEAFK